MRLRRLALAAALLAALPLAAAGLDRLYPLPLERYRERSTTVVDAAGGLLRPFATADGTWRLATRAADVDPRYLAMLQAYEDQRFEAHPGVDPLALGRAALQWVRHGRIVSGGSTLAMQAARLLEPRPRGFGAKVVQIGRALQLVHHEGREGVLAVYLTLAPFGGNLEGVRAASLAWFGVEPQRLSLGQAALLVALPQSPERLRPDRDAEAARRGRDKVLRTLHARGRLSDAELAEGLAEAVPDRRLPLPFQAPHLAERLASAAAPGSTIATWIDPALQQALAGFAAREAAFLEPGVALAILAVENRDRKVRGYLGGIDPEAPGGRIDLARARRSPGSALKPFIYAQAFEEGLVHPETLIEDAPMRFGGYEPRNFGRDFQGLVRVREALQHSLNVPAVALLQRLGPARAAAALGNAGAILATPRGAAPGLPLALGGVGISLHDLVMLYAGLADDGRMLPLAEAPGPQPAARRFVAAAAAREVSKILAGAPVPDGIAAAAAVQRRRIAFKTGTSYGFRDAWALGYSPGWTIGIWVGRPDGTARPGHFGRNTALPLLFRAFDLLPPEPAAEPVWRERAEAARPAPAGLGSFGREGFAPRGERADGGAKLRILFPPDGAVIEWPAEGAPGPLPLEARGGQGALHWLVDGRPLPPRAAGEGALFRPEAEGFARIAVIDAAGRSAAATIRLKRPD